MLRNKKPPSAANAHTAITVAPENGALRKNLRHVLDGLDVLTRDPCCSSGHVSAI